MSQPRVRYVSEPKPPPSDSNVTLDLLALLLFAFTPVVVGLGALGYSITDIKGWYSEADIAPWTPELNVFIPVWLALYALIGTSTWLVWRRRRTHKIGGALFVYGLHIILNGLWVVVFFTLYDSEGLGALWLALAILSFLIVLTVITIAMFDRASKTAAWLFVPYLAWLCLIASMNTYMAVNN